MIDNKKLIIPLLNFEEEGDFYMLYVFKRKKDQPVGERDNHQSVRTIKSYCITSVEYLEKRWEEIMMLCEVFKARGYIHVQKQNHKDVGLELMSEVAQRLKNGVINQMGAFDSVVGQLKTRESRWIVDIDDAEHCKSVDDIVAYLTGLRPIGDKVEAIIPTKNGIHLITKRFDVVQFYERYPITIQKKNPTLIYLPNSLHNED